MKLPITTRSQPVVFTEPAAADASAPIETGSAKTVTRRQHLLARRDPPMLRTSSPPIRLRDDLVRLDEHGTEHSPHTNHGPGRNATGHATTGSRRRRRTGSRHLYYTMSILQRDTTRHVNFGPLISAIAYTATMKSTPTVSLRWRCSGPCRKRTYWLVNLVLDPFMIIRHT